MHYGEQLYIWSAAITQPALPPCSLPCASCGDARPREMGSVAWGQCIFLLGVLSVFVKGFVSFGFLAVYRLLLSVSWCRLLIWFDLIWFWISTIWFILWVPILAGDCSLLTDAWFYQILGSWGWVGPWPLACWKFNSSTGSTVLSLSQEWCCPTQMSEWLAIWRFLSPRGGWQMMRLWGAWHLAPHGQTAGRSMLQRKKSLESWLGQQWWP